MRTHAADGTNPSGSEPGEEAAVHLVVEHDPNPAKFEAGGNSGYAYTCDYMTTVQAVGGGVRIEKFGMYFWRNGQWELNSTYSQEDFAEWYACPGAYITPGQA
ncbi:MAG: hypothetical protein PVH17_06550, partial [Anaerolineae bacterium]